MSRTTRRSRRGPLLVLVTLLVAVGALLLWTRSGDPAPAAAGTATAAPTTGTAPSSATPSPTGARTAAPSSTAPAADAGPTATEEDDEPAPQPAPTSSPQDDVPVGALHEVAVALTYAGYDPSGPAVAAGGYAADVVEEDATCTLVLRRNGIELRGESLGTPSATTTDCGEVRVGGDELTSGTWEAVLGYTSDTSFGESSAVEVMVP